MPPETTPRSEKRATFEDKVRIMLLEQDVDTIEGSMGEIVQEQKKGNRIAMAILVSLTSGALLLAIQLVSGTFASQ